MAQNKHKTKRRIISIFCASLIALYALAIPIGAVTNSSQTTAGSTALYGVSPFPYTVGFVLNDETTNRNYIFATDVGGLGLANNETTSGEDTFEWHYPDSTDTNMSSISYSNVEEAWLENTLHWYANRSTEYGSNYGNFYGGYGQMTLLYQSLDSGFFPTTESIVFKSNSVVYNTIWATDQTSINTFEYLENPTPIEFMMPAVLLPQLDDNSTQAYVGSYSVQVLITDAFGNSEWHQYSVPIDTRGTDAEPIPFIDYDVIKQYIKLNGDYLDEDETSKTILIEEYRGFLDVDYYEFVEPGAELETFTIGGNSYQFEAGMTWGEFVSSSYNPNTNYGANSNHEKMFQISNNGVYYSQDEYNWRPVTTIEAPTDIIESNTLIVAGPYTYYVEPGGANDLGMEGPSAGDYWRPDDGPSASTYDVAPTAEGTWEIIDDADKLNTINITFPMYNTAGGEGVSAGAQSLLSFPTADKYAIERVSNIDITPQIPTYDEIPEDMFEDYAGWLANGVGGFFRVQIFPGIALGGIVGILVMFGCTMAILKIFAGG